MAEKHEQAYVDYQNGMKYKDIAAKYSVSIDAVRKWKTRYGWTKNSVHKNCTQNQKDVHKKPIKNNAVNTDKILIESVEKNEGLSDEQRLFCLFYIKSHNASRSYQKAYGCSLNTAYAHAWKMLKNEEIKSEIKKLKEIRNMDLLANIDDLVEFHMMVAFSDITDFISFGRETVPVMGLYGPVVIKDEETGKETAITKDINVVRFRESEDIDGRLINEVKQGKDGASVKLANREKSLAFLERWFTANPLDKHKIDYDNRRLALEESKAGKGGDELAASWFDELLKDEAIRDDG